MGVLLGAATGEPAIYLVVLLGLGVVFVGLFGVILVCKVMSLVNVKKKPEPAASVQTAAEPIQPNEPISGELAAVIGCAIAEELGTDVSAIRIVSIKKK